MLRYFDLLKALLLLLNFWNEEAKLKMGFQSLGRFFSESFKRWMVNILLQKTIQNLSNVIVLPHGTDKSCDRLWYLFTWVCCKQIMQKKIKGALYCIINYQSKKTTPRDSIPISYLAKNWLNSVWPPPPKAWSTL